MNGSFRENLRSELDYQDVTVKELCARTGLPKATIECYLGARANMPLADNAYRIARALNVSVEYLLEGEEGAGERNAALKGRKRELFRVIKDLDGEADEILMTLAKALKKAQERRRKG